LFIFCTLFSEKNIENDEKEWPQHGYMLLPDTENEVTNETNQMQSISDPIQNNNYQMENEEFNIEDEVINYKSH
jgi:hypothetical protein